MLHRLSMFKPPPLALDADGRYGADLVDLSRHPQVVQESTQSFLATATAARFLAFLPPREAIR